MWNDISSLFLKFFALDFCFRNDWWLVAQTSRDTQRSLDQWSLFESHYLSIFFNHPPLLDPAVFFKASTKSSSSSRNHLKEQGVTYNLSHIQEQILSRQKNLKSAWIVSNFRNEFLTVKKKFNLMNVYCFFSVSTLFLWYQISILIVVVVL